MNSRPTDVKPSVLTYVGFVAMILVGLVGAWALGRHALTEWETGTAIGSTAPWLVLVVALSAFAFWSRRIAPWVLAALTVFAVVRGPVEAAAADMDLDDPFSAVWVLALGVAVAFLGLHLPRPAGVLLTLLGVSQLVALLVADDTGTAGLGELLTSYAGAVVVPIFVVAALFLAGGALAAVAVSCPDRRRSEEW